MSREKTCSRHSHILLFYLTFFSAHGEAITLRRPIANLAAVTTAKICQRHDGMDEDIVTKKQSTGHELGFRNKGDMEGYRSLRGITPTLPPTRPSKCLWPYSHHVYMSTLHSWRVTHEATCPPCVVRHCLCVLASIKVPCDIRDTVTPAKCETHGLNRPKGKRVHVSSQEQAGLDKPRYTKYQFPLYTVNCIVQKCIQQRKKQKSYHWEYGQ